MNEYLSGGSKGDGGVLKVEESAVAAYAPSAGCAVAGWGDIVSPRREEAEEYGVSEKEHSEASKRFGWNEIGKIKIVGDIMSPLCVENDEVDGGGHIPFRENVEYATPEEIREVFSKVFNYEEIDKLGRIEILGDIVSPLYKEVDE